MKKHYQLLTVAALTLASSTGFASNFKWLEYSPTSRFTEADWEMLKASGIPLLENGKTGESASWSNDKTGNGGKFTITGSSERNGAPCHTLDIENYSKSLRGGGTFDFCKQPDGKWKSPQSKL